MISLAKLLLKLAELLQALLTLWSSQRRAGRAEAVFEQMEANNDALRKADAARARRRELDADTERLRADDGFRRD